MNGLALCAGVGGLELGISLAEPGYRCVGYVERDACAAAVLVARMEDATLDSAPVWDDIASFDGRAWRGRVDCISAGFPCQPASAAGKRRGLEDERWIWPHIERIIREVEPTFVYLENVPGLLWVRGGMGAVLGSLAALGFDAEWTVLGADDLGATHRRERVFILAYRDSFDVADATGEREREPDDAAGAESRSRSRTRGRGGELADADEVGRRPRERDVHAGEPDVDGSGEIGIWPPGPGDAEGWRRTLAADATVEPAICRVADGLPNRMDRLRCLGNGVVPIVAATAWRELMHLIMTQPEEVGGEHRKDGER